MNNSKDQQTEDNFLYDRRMSGTGRGHGRRRKHGCGRPPITHSIKVNPQVAKGKGVLKLSNFELQLLRLSDIEELTQHQIAE